MSDYNRHADVYSERRDLGGAIARGSKSSTAWSQLNDDRIQYPPRSRRSHCSHRSRGHGRSLQNEGYAPRSDGGDQGPPRAPRREPRAKGPLRNHEGARGLLEEVERDVATGKDSSYSKALIHFGHGDTQRCLDALEALTEETPAILVPSAWLNVDPFWNPLRDDPRFQDLLRRMNFPD